MVPTPSPCLLHVFSTSSPRLPHTVSTSSPRPPHVSPLILPLLLPHKPPLPCAPSLPSTPLCLSTRSLPVAHQHPSDLHLDCVEQLAQRFEPRVADLGAVLESFESLFADRVEASEVRCIAGVAAEQGDAGGEERIRGCCWRLAYMHAGSLNGRRLNEREQKGKM